ncbi:MULTISPECIES: cobalamin-independent methionine synthase II family protein [unclassified Actinomyces]|uniref:cobalamin-independent methionine synthase II family protein n=1 Tax=unclassified Actinomyces TaxID=2609248 RepID=UPI0020180E23|nr:MULTISPECIES: cobalamin-independent methionine synthase II family protein [unclassified Actinomyces]MCL3778216.1 cobalamin-independent methionine synthase II family protein [Actinomyces sp. AC-20-1]MCL3789119.1 cobalamin-independent methionine synthase II family protein [Actinomyces sp. 187325]MCL3791474.1 cobalamin-independent methionine synthase II family protein [Actinomyces sp. 186855]MCL3794064.1 cobalamin-independent methionine synthase II family protein [Actinomyces sp. 217892]
MTTRIRTTHVGSLPRTDALLEANAAHAAGALDDAGLAAVVTAETDAVVARQVATGIDIVNDGEYGHFMAEKVDYGGWWQYTFDRFSGLEIVTELPERRPTPAGKLELDAMGARRDWTTFADAYSDPTSGIHLATMKAPVWPTVTGEIRFTGHEVVTRDVEATLAALAKAGKPVSDGFIASISPAAAARIGNYYYEDDEAAVWAWAEALREEYRAITDAGLTVQIDAPDLAESWDQFIVEPSLEDYRRFSEVRIEALNHALEGIDPALVRYHVCWGSWHGPHSTDLGFDKIVDLALAVNANGLSFEAANARHEHEWRIWKDIVADGALADGKYLIPGVVGHATNVIEHPELVADRIERFAAAVGPERVVASTDCGLGGRVHPHIAWAKLEALAEGARLASDRL